MNRGRIGVIDHGAGNLVSIARALAAVGAEVAIVGNAGDLTGVDGIVLPGVGHTGAAMRALGEAGLVGPLRETDLPLLGICVGLQLFFETSDEDGGASLGLIPGAVRRLVDAPTLPHMGWNRVELSPDEPLFSGIESGAHFYFVHSFAPVPADPATVVATAHHGAPLVAAVRQRNLIGTQFHPERSGADGLRLLDNFLTLVTSSSQESVAC